MLTENLEVTINFHDEKPINISLPNQITMQKVKQLMLH